MSVLNITFRFKVSRLFRKIFFAESFGNKFITCLPCFFWNTKWVCSHISDKTDCAKLACFNTFIKFLRRFHRSFCLEWKTPWRFLLKCGSDKRRCRIFLSAAFFNTFYNITCTFKFSKNSITLLLIFNFDFFAVFSWKRGWKYFSFRWVGKSQKSGKVPRNRFSLTIGVSCEIYIICTISLFLKIFYKVFLSFYYCIFRFKIICNINTEPCCRQISYMAHWCNYIIASAKIAFNILCLCRWLHNY